MYTGPVLNESDSISFLLIILYILNYTLYFTLYFIF